MCASAWYASLALPGLGMLPPRIATRRNRIWFSRRWAWWCFAWSTSARASIFIESCAFLYLMKRKWSRALCSYSLSFSSLRTVARSARLCTGSRTHLKSDQEWKASWSTTMWCSYFGSWCQCFSCWACKSALSERCGWRSCTLWRALKGMRIWYTLTIPTISWTRTPVMITSPVRTKKCENRTQ